MAYRNIENINIENAHILFRNFAGKEGKFNRAGERSFCVIIEDLNTVEALKADGWNLAILAPRDPQDEPRHYLRVKVKFDFRPPTVFMVTSKNKTKLDEESIASLDYAELKNVDLTISPYQWEVSGRSGVTAYLKTMYATIEEDAFAAKYAEEEYPTDDIY